MKVTIFVSLVLLFLLLLIKKGTSIQINKAPTETTNCCNCLCDKSFFCQYILIGSSSWEQLAQAWVNALNALPQCTCPEAGGGPLGILAKNLIKQNACFNCLATYIETDSGNGYTSSFENTVKINVGLASRIYTAAELADFCQIPIPTTTYYYQPANLTTCVVKSTSAIFTPSTLTSDEFCSGFTQSPIPFFTTFNVPVSFSAPTPSSQGIVGRVVGTAGVTPGCATTGHPVSATQIEAAASTSGGVGGSTTDVGNYVASHSEAIGIVSLGTLLSNPNLEEIIINNVSCKSDNNWTQGPIYFVLNNAETTQSITALNTLLNLLTANIATPNNLGLTGINSGWQ
jgi:hypothetical protein